MKEQTLTRIEKALTADAASATPTYTADGRKAIRDKARALFEKGRDQSDVKAGLMGIVRTDDSIDEDDKSELEFAITSGVSLDAFVDEVEKVSGKLA